MGRQNTHREEVFLKEKHLKIVLIIAATSMDILIAGGWPTGEGLPMLTLGKFRSYPVSKVLQNS